jgi:hypothetical protein
MAKSIPWNRFLGSLKSLKIRSLWCMQRGGRAKGARDGDAGGGATEDAGRYRQRGGRSNPWTR